MNAHILLYHTVMATKSSQLQCHCQSHSKGQPEDVLCLHPSQRLIPKKKSCSRTLKHLLLEHLFQDHCNAIFFIHVDILFNVLCFLLFFDIPILLLKPTSFYGIYFKKYEKAVWVRVNMLQGTSRLICETILDKKIQHL